MRTVVDGIIIGLFKSLVCILCVIVLSCCQSKNDKADKLFANQKFSEAFQLYNQSARNGSAYAKWRLCEAYANGLGTEPSNKRALTLLKEAADQGCEEAMCDLGLAMLSGWYGMGTDEEKGKEILKNLWEKTENSYCESRHAQVLLWGHSFDKDETGALRILDEVKDKKDRQYLVVMGCLYLKGIDGIESDFDKAKSYLENAYRRGSGSAAAIISDMYNDEQALGKNVDLRIKWLKNGIAFNNTDCMKALASIRMSEDTIYSRFHDVSSGIELLKRAGKLGDGDAYCQLGGDYFLGKGVLKNDKKAFKYYKKAYELGSINGTNNLGAMYFDGHGCDKDVAKAISLYKEAAEKGYAFSNKNLYWYYYHPEYGDSHEANPKLAKHYLLKAAELGDENGCSILGDHYYRGSDLFEQDYYQAFIYYKQSADLGNLSVAGRVAYMYENGLGTDMDPNMAEKYRDMTLSDTEKNKRKDNDTKKEDE